MYKYSEIKVREIADHDKLSSFEESIGIPINWNLVEHMKCDQNGADDISGDYLYLNKAKDCAEAALFYRLTKDPTKQSRGEKQQHLSLINSFDGLSKLDPGSITLINGKKFLASQIMGGVQDDLDFEILSEKVVITAKDVDGRGGGQDDQFNEMESLIQKAGAINDADSYVLGIYLNGSLWNRSRKKYRNYQTNHKFPMSLSVLLQQLSKNKKIVIFSDNDLPAVRTKFRTHFKI